jgi:hypothetical protein
MDLNMIIATTIVYYMTAIVPFPILVYNFADKKGISFWSVFSLMHNWRVIILQYMDVLMLYFKKVHGWHLRILWNSHISGYNECKHML